MSVNLRDGYAALPLIHEVTGEYDANGEMRCVLCGTLAGTADDYGAQHWPYKSGLVAQMHNAWCQDITVWGPGVRCVTLATPDAPDTFAAVRLVP